MALAGWLWSFSAGLAAWLWFPCPPAIIGACLGSGVATMLAMNGSRPAFVKAGAAWLLLAILAASLGQNAIFLLTAESSLLARAGLLSGLTAFSAVLLAHWASRFPGTQIPECALYASPCLALVWGHRSGRLDQPAGLVESAWAVGLDPFRLFGALGIALGTALLLLLISRRSRTIRGRSLFFVVLAGTLCVLSFPLSKVARLSSEIARNSSPSSGGGGKDQRQDAPVAIVVLQQDYDPEMGLYHFDSQAQPPEDASLAAEGQAMRYRVAEMVRQTQPLVLGWSPRFVAIPPSDAEAFARVYDVESHLVTTPLADLLDTRGPTTGSLPERPYRALAREIVPETKVMAPLRAALSVKLWMEQNRSQTQELQSQSEDSVEACLAKNQPVSQKTYTLAARELLSALGLTTRLAHGYAVRADQKGEGSSLLLTESDRRYWLELRLPRGGWVPIDLYPLNGPSDSDGPQQENLQRRLGELARARGKAESKHFQGLGMGAVGFLLFLAIVLSGGLIIKTYRALRVLWCAPERLPLWGYIAVLDRLAEVGELRQAGETRHEFAIRLKDRVPSLEALTHLHQMASLGRPHSGGFSHARALTLAALGECDKGFPLLRRLAGKMHPFAWMKVV